MQLEILVRELFYLEPEINITQALVMTSEELTSLRLEVERYQKEITDLKQKVEKLKEII